MSTVVPTASKGAPSSDKDATNQEMAAAIVDSAAMALIAATRKSLKMVEEGVVEEEAGGGAMIVPMSDEDDPGAAPSRSVLLLVDSDGEEVTKSVDKHFLGSTTSLASRSSGGTASNRVIVFKTYSTDSGDLGGGLTSQLPERSSVSTGGAIGEQGGSRAPQHSAASRNLPLELSGVGKSDGSLSAAAAEPAPPPSLSFGGGAAASRKSFRKSKSCIGPPPPSVWPLEEEDEELLEQEEAGEEVAPLPRVGGLVYQVYRLYVGTQSSVCIFVVFIVAMNDIQILYTLSSAGRSRLLPSFCDRALAGCGSLRRKRRRPARDNPLPPGLPRRRPPERTCCRPAGREEIGLPRNPTECQSPQPLLLDLRGPRACPRRPALHCAGSVQPHPILGEKKNQLGGTGCGRGGVRRGRSTRAVYGFRPKCTSLLFWFLLITLPESGRVEDDGGPRGGKVFLLGGEEEKTEFFEKNRVVHFSFIVRLHKPCNTTGIPVRRGGKKSGQMRRRG